MFQSIQRLWQTLIRKSTQIYQEPINKISIVILILIDLFVLMNVFGGLESISQWPLNPTEEIPCYAPYNSYQNAKDKGTLPFDIATLENIINQYKFPDQPRFDTSKRLGQVSAVCDTYKQLEKAVNNPQNRTSKASLDQGRILVSRLEQENQTLQSQYDSTLLEKIAGQSPKQSINQETADTIKSKIESNKTKIAAQKNKIEAQKKEFRSNPASAAYLQLLNDKVKYQKVKNAYDSTQFWHPNKQLLLQTLFLLPLISIAYLWHRRATNRNQGLQALLSWHLLLIFCIPLLIKIFEFVQFGNLVRVAIDGIIALLGGLLFIASYALILIIPVLGYGLIQFLQRFVFNSQIQAKNRVQKKRCIRCNFKLRPSDECCPHCGYNQYTECESCHRKTYRLMNFCSACGQKMPQDRSNAARQA